MTGQPTEILTAPRYLNPTEMERVADLVAARAEAIYLLAWLNREHPDRTHGTIKIVMGIKRGGDTYGHHDGSKIARDLLVAAIKGMLAHAEVELIRLGIHIEPAR